MLQRSKNLSVQFFEECDKTKRFKRHVLLKKIAESLSYDTANMSNMLFFNLILVESGLTWLLKTKRFEPGT